MRCSNCGIDNLAGSRFCNQCGTPLGEACAKCGAENLPDAKFCSQCGVSLDVLPNRVTEAEPHEHSPAGERRHLTVVFCDLVGSTEIAAQLDPEEWREMIAGYHRATAEAITRYAGHVAKYLGDG
jgi:class 3 adenylate cyclase